MASAPPDHPLRATCLVNNYNYGRYVVAAVESALAQAPAFDEVVVVDDGSTDESRSLLRRAFDAEPRVRLIEQCNEGQLACFQRGLAASTGDLVFFLDADDVYEPGYLGAVREIYRARTDVHCIVSAYRTFGDEERVVRRFDRDRDLGPSAVLALTRSLAKLWVSPTSTLSMRRAVLERFLPLGCVEDWRTRADDCLLFGSSLAGARKFYSARALVSYRVHGDNHWYGRAFDAAYEAEREAAVDRLFVELIGKLDLGDLAEHVAGEFARVPDPTLRRLRHYVRIARGAPRPLGVRARLVARLVGGYLRRTSRAPGGPAASRPVRPNLA